MIIGLHLPPFLGTTNIGLAKPTFPDLTFLLLRCSTSSKRKNPLSSKSKFFDGAGPGAWHRLHATNQAYSEGEGEADTTSNHRAASSASCFQIPTQWTNMPNKSKNNYQSFLRTHIHSWKHKKFSNTVEGPDSGLMDPPSGGRLPDRFLISAPGS